MPPRTHRQSGGSGPNTLSAKLSTFSSSITTLCRRVVLVAVLDFITANTPLSSAPPVSEGRVRCRRFALAISAGRSIKWNPRIKAVAVRRSPRTQPQTARARRTSTGRGVLVSAGVKTCHCFCMRQLACNLPTTMGYKSWSPANR
eukprot:6466947-Amphidinium_carterae.2